MDAGAELTKGSVICNAGQWPPLTPADKEERLKMVVRSVLMEIACVQRWEAEYRERGLRAIADAACEALNGSGGRATE